MANDSASPSDTAFLISLARELGYEVGYPDTDEERAWLGSDAGVTNRNRRCILLSEALQPGAHTDIVLLHEIGHLFQGDHCILESGEPATSALELEHDAWARAEKLLEGFRLHLDRKYFAAQRDKALGVSAARGF